MKHTHHRDELPEENKARMYLTDRDDFGASHWRPAPQYLEAHKSEIEETILKFLGDIEVPLCNLVERVMDAVKPKPHLAEMAGVLNELHGKGVIEISEFISHRLSPRDLDVNVRFSRAGKDATNAKNEEIVQAVTPEWGLFGGDS